MLIIAGPEETKPCPMENHIPTSVVVVEAKARERRRLEEAVERTPGYCRGGGYADGADALPWILESRPPIVLLDWLTPVIDGFACLRELRRRLPEARVVIMADGRGEAMIDVAKKLQASGLWVKPCAVAPMLAALNGLAAGRFIRGRSDLWTLVSSQPTVRPNLAFQPPSLWTVLDEFHARPEGEGICAAIAAAAHYRVPELADLFRSSLRQLDRRFVQVFGETPQDWLTRHRMLEARKMLETGYSCKDCATGLGYNHASNFSSAFSHCHGASPRHFAKANAVMA
jgi:AraC-like DNA-binding protein/CheY-like chemotaxis protein